MKFKTGLVGFGAIGTGVVRLLTEQGDPLAKRTGVDVSVERLAVGLVGTRESNANEDLRR